MREGEGDVEKVVHMSLFVSLMSMGWGGQDSENEVFAMHM